MSDGTREALLLALTAIAAVGGVTGVWLVIWSWIDRPQHLWGVRFARELVEDVRQGATGIDFRQKTVDDKHKVNVSIGALGTRPAHDVWVRVHGCSLLGATPGHSRAQITPASEPTQLEIWIPKANAEPALLEILWLQNRPHRHRGQRIDLRTERTVALWRWSWRRLRFRGWRLARTTGRWVERRVRDCPEIPDTKGALVSEE